MITTSQNTPLVYIVLLNYCGAHDTVDCLESLRGLDYPNYRIIVVDNASPDHSLEILRREQGPLNFELLESPVNNGYSAGNNVALREILDRHANDPTPEQPYIWLLNNDTTVEPNSLSALVSEAKKTGGLVGSLLMYPDRTYQQVGTRINWNSGSTRGIPESEIRDGMPVDCLSGASMLIPAVVLRNIGLLDESYFLYFEDAEFCLRAARRNFPRTVALHSRVYHKEGATTGRKSPTTQYYYHRNRLRVLSQYASPGQRMRIMLYSGFRLFRSVVKSKLQPTPERVASVQIQQWAMSDFRKGVSGKCPHDLSHLQTPA